MPAGWIYIAGFGIRQMSATPGAIVASVGLGQDTLAEDSGLPAYIEKQMKMIGDRLQEVKSAGPKETPFAGADEAHLLFIRHRMDSAGAMLHVQTYVRVGLWLGIVTLTALESQLSAVRPDFDAFVRGLRIGPQTAG
jgi:hypothetical protein